ncbi:MAG: 16S rRNA (cytidine(1402)-2'-O)-methyltransferase [Oligoflexia bacterium]|nr:16S rRNA (cytidine(1402)-2'-O)-methyltransferase [Oligoflexia bacterium]
MANKIVSNINKLEPALYVIATPIGNIQDWTHRAINTLQNCDIVACEDTRVLKQLLQKSDILVKKLITYHEHNEKASAKGIIELIQNGKSVGLTTDAGTPQISDPGFKVIKLAYENNIKVIPVPGVSSLTAALSISALGGGSIYFGGFLPSGQSTRIKKLKETMQSADQIVFYEAPHRLRDSLLNISEVFGQNTSIMVCRELTKPYEETFCFTVIEAIKHFKITEPRGEFILILKSPKPTKLAEIETKTQIQTLLESGYSAQEILENLLPVSELSRKSIYSLIVTIKKLLEKV